MIKAEAIAKLNSEQLEASIQQGEHGPGSQSASTFPQALEDHWGITRGRTT